MTSRTGTFGLARILNASRARPAAASASAAATCLIIASRSSLSRSKSFILNSIPCAGLVAVLAASPAAAQPTNEFAVGGGWHVPFNLGGDWITMPSVPSVEARVTRWTGEKLGFSGRFMMGFGSVDTGESGIVERRHPKYLDIIMRYRTEPLSGAGRTYFGIGGGIISWGETFWNGDDGTVVGPYFLALEAMRSFPLNDRLDMNIGVTMIPAVYVQPVVMLSWAF